MDCTSGSGRSSAGKHPHDPIGRRRSSHVTYLRAASSDNSSGGPTSRSRRYGYDFRPAGERTCRCGGSLIASTANRHVACRGWAPVGAADHGHQRVFCCFVSRPRPAGDGNSSAKKVPRCNGMVRLDHVAALGNNGSLGGWGARFTELQRHVGTEPARCRQSGGGVGCGNGLTMSVGRRALPFALGNDRTPFARARFQLKAPSR